MLYELLPLALRFELHPQVTIRFLDFPRDVWRFHREPSYPMFYDQVALPASVVLLFRFRTQEISA